MKKISLILILILISSFLIGCWDYSEIEDVSIASNLAIDLDEESGLYIVNVEMIDIDASTAGIDLKPLIIESKGTTIIEAIRNVISVSYRRVNLTHANAIILSDAVARQGIAPVLDWISRHPGARLTLHIFVSKEKTAKEILLKEQEITKIRTLEFEKTIKSNKFLSKSPHIEAHKIINQISNPEVFTVLPTLELTEINNESFVNSKGSAYFIKEKLAGFFDPMETMKYLFIVDEIEGGILVIPTGDKSDDKVSLDIYKNKTDINMDFENDNITVNINMNTVVSIAEIDNEVDYTNKEGRKKLKKLSEEFMEKEIENFIRTVQRDPGIDVFNFGNKIKKRYPKLWKSIENDWDNIFKELNIVVNSNIKIRNSEHISSPINVSNQ